MYGKHLRMCVCASDGCRLVYTYIICLLQGNIAHTKSHNRGSECYTLMLERNAMKGNIVCTLHVLILLVDVAFTKQLS